MPEDESEQIGYDEMSAAFRGEEVERDGILLEIEAIHSESDSPEDNDARYSLSVRARSTDSDNSEGEST